MFRTYVFAFVLRLFKNTDLLLLFFLIGDLWLYRTQNISYLDRNGNGRKKFEFGKMVNLPQNKIMEKQYVYK